MQSERLLPAHEVERVIEAAFAKVKLGNGVGLEEAQGIDDYVDDKTRAALRFKDEKNDWRRISVEALNSCNSSLCFFDAEGMRFHLPAYLVADLRGEYNFGMAFCLTQFGSFDCFNLLSTEQRKAVRVFLLYILEVPDYQFHRPHILKALVGYWAEGTEKKKNKKAD